MKSSVLLFSIFVALLIPAGLFAQTGQMHDHAAMSHDQPATVDHDRMFVDAMTMHHKEGIRMAQMAVDKAVNSDLRAMAQTMIDDQRREIDQMQALRPEGPVMSMADIHKAMGMEKMHGDMHGEMSDKQHGEMHGQMQGSMHGEMHGQMQGDMSSMMEKQMSRLEAAQGNDFDLAFTEIMPMHHQGAIMMARHELKNGSNAGLKEIARQIVDKQTRERERLMAMHGDMSGTHEAMTSSASSAHEHKRITKD